MKRVINGEELDVPEEDVPAILAEWDAAAAAAPARDAERTRLAAHDDAIKGDATVQQLRGMTVAEFDAWWTANVTTVAQASNVLKRVTRVVLRRVL